MNVYLETGANCVKLILYRIVAMAQVYLTKTLFKYLARHIPKEALAGNKKAWTLDIMARAVLLIENGYKLLSTIHRHLRQFKTFIDSLETDQVDGAQGAPEDRIDQTSLNDALVRIQIIKYEEEKASLIKKLIKTV